MELKIDPNDMKAIVSAAILDKMSREQRDVLVQEAIASLLVPQKQDSYSRVEAKTKLQDAFSTAAYTVTVEIVREHLRTDEAFRGAVTTMVTRGILSLLDNESDSAKLSGSVASIIAALFEKAAGNSY